MTPVTLVGTHINTGTAGVFEFVCHGRYQYNKGMQRRLIYVVLMVGLSAPVTVMADASAAGLGPASTTSGNSSSADATALQPAGTSTLQNSGDSSGLSSSTSDGASLQQPATSDNSKLQVFLGSDADGASHGTPSSTSVWWYVIWIILGLAIIAAGLWVWRRYRTAAVAAPQLDIDLATVELEEFAAEAVVERTLIEESPEDIGKNGQNDETAPPIVVETANKTGDDSGKPRSKHHKNRKRRGRK